MVKWNSANKHVDDIVMITIKTVDQVFAANERAAGGRVADDGGSHS